MRQRRKDTEKTRDNGRQYEKWKMWMEEKEQEVNRKGKRWKRRQMDDEGIEKEGRRRINRKRQGEKRRIVGKGGIIDGGGKQMMEGKKMEGNKVDKQLLLLLLVLLLLLLVHDSPGVRFLCFTQHFEQLGASETQPGLPVLVVQLNDHVLDLQHKEHTLLSNTITHSSNGATQG